MLNILVVEDDQHLNRIVSDYLTNKGYKVTSCLNASDAYDALYGSLFDLIISDIMMPNIDGYEFAETVRGLDKNIPILFMTARDDLMSKQRGFSLGIDDYMVKPVNLDELVMRVEALLRRANIMNEKQLVVGNLVLDVDSMTATVAGDDIPLTVREFNIIFKLLSYPNKTFSRAQLMDEFWGMDTDTSLRSVDVYITKLRQKFSACEAFKIATVHGLGYKVVLVK